MLLVEETPIPDAALPVAQFKAHLRLGTGFADDDLQDALVSGHLRAALAAIEARTGKILISRRFSWSVRAWRDAYCQPLPAAPVSAVSAMTLIARQGQELAVDAARWVLREDAHRPEIAGPNGPLPVIPHLGKVKVFFDAGFGAAWDDLPSDLAQAVLLLAGHFYEHRHGVEGRASELPLQVAALIAPYRTVRIFMGGGRA